VPSSNTSSNKPTASTRSAGSTSSLRASSGSRPFDKTQGKPAASMAELMSRKAGNLQILRKGQQITGTIKKLTPREILMDIEAKGDALVIEYDRQNLENLLTFLKVGDRVSATVISPESEEGFPVLSLRRTLDDIIFERLEELSKKEEAFEVEVVESTRGGYFALTSQGIKGFLPSSQVSGGENLAGRKIQVKILEFDRARKRIVFSQKALNFVMNPATLREFVKPGETVEGEILSVAPYGVFVSISKNGSGDGKAAEGFIHISEVSYQRVENLPQKYKSGEKIKAQVIDVDSASRRVNLSIKRTEKDAFENAKEKYKPEQKIKGKVLDVKTRGVTFELESGINGFISSSKIPQGQTYNPGDTVEAEIVSIDEKRRVVILSPVLKAVPIGYR